MQTGRNSVTIHIVTQNTTLEFIILGEIRSQQLMVSCSQCKLHKLSEHEWTWISTSNKEASDFQLKID